MINAATFGAPNWVDLSTPNIDGAVDFYGELLGWNVTTMSTPMGEYHIGKVGDHQAAGMMAQGPQLLGQPPVWSIFIHVKDIEDTLNQVEEALGHVLAAPFEIPGGALVSVIADTTGAMMSVVAGGETPDGVYFSNEPGAVCWMELLTRDLAKAAAFYADVFGWTTTTANGDGTEYTMFKLGGEDVAGMMMMPDEVPAEAPAHWAVYFTVDDCAAAAKMTDELGGRVLMPTTEIGMGRFAVLEDPQGAKFDVMEFA